MVCAHPGQNPVSPICCMAPAGDATVLGLVSLLKGLAAAPTFEEPGWLSKTVSEVHEIWVWISGRSVHPAISGEQKGKKFLAGAP